MTARPGQASTAWQTGLAPFPDRMDARLHYAETVALTLNLVATATTYQFRASSIWDPNSTGTGHQPYQRDQIAAMYSYYKVHKCSYRITFFRPQVTGLWVGVNVYSSLGTSASVNGLTLETIVERQHDAMTILPTAGPGYAIVQGSVDLAGLHGLTKSQYLTDNTNFGASITANPSQNGIVEVVFVDPDARANEYIYALVELEYDVQCYGYNPPAQS